MKTKPYRNKRYLDWLRTLSCVKCGSPYVITHHLLRGVFRGMGRRADDSKAIPLCDAEHKALHDSGDEVLFLGSIDGPALAAALHGVWENGADIEEAQRLIDCPPRRE